MSELFMGVDIGTTGVRAAIFNREGRQLGYSYREYPMRADTRGKAELEPDGVFGAFLEVVREAVEENNCSRDIEAIGICSQMHSLVAVDDRGNCLTNIITWADNRPSEEAKFIEDNFECSELYGITGCRVQHQAYYPAKIRWLKRHYPGIYSKTYKYLTIKALILFRLFGEFIIDISDASATACFNIHKFQWEDTVLKELAGIDRSRLGEASDCTRILRNMKKEYAGKMGLDESVPVVIGSSDGIMANLGCGGTDGTTMSCTVGTSGALRVASDKPLLDGRQRTWCYCLDESIWVAGGVVNDGGIDLKWFRDSLKGPYEEDMKNYGLKDIYQLFDRYAGEISPGSDGLMFLPYLNGERSPGWHPDAAAHICGVRYGHGTRHFIRAAMEGVLYNLYTIYNSLSRVEAGVERIVANGGYVKSKLWLQMQADIFNKEIYVSEVGEATAWGTAFTAMVGVGAADGFSSIKRSYSQDGGIRPAAENHEVYKNAYTKFLALYNQLINK